MTIDPILSLALNLHASKGVYALLLGSGVSRSAKIPTGWEVLLDLIRGLAKMEGAVADCEPDPAGWFERRYGEPPDYSKLLDRLATTPEQRQQILRDYFEPTAEEREQGLKQPTPAHRAIARLVAAGYVRVIITTNFDRLLEIALQDLGIAPVVLSTTDSMAGALPLVHQKCVILKVHGDYLDPRIKNTPVELEQYDEVVNDYLDRIFDEFGLIVVGWSGEADSALRAAIQRCKTRRFGWYWAALSEPTGHAAELIALRGVAFLRIAGADQFFAELANKLEALADVHADHPLNTAVAVALVKRYLMNPAKLVSLDDLLLKEAERAAAQIESVNEEVRRASQRELYRRALQTYAAATKTLRAMVGVAAYWGQEQVIPSLLKCVMRLGREPALPGGGVILNDAVRLFPAMLVAYAAGLGFLAVEGFNAAASLLLRAKTHSYRDAQPLLRGYCDHRLDFDSFVKSLDQYNNRKTAFSDFSFDQLAADVREIFADPTEYETRFDEWELLIALLHADIKFSQVIPSDERLWMTPGRWAWRLGNYGVRSPLFPHEGEGNDLDLIQRQVPFQQLIEAGHFGGDWSRLARFRRAIASTASHERFLF